jgi:CheY-like chemotaxis protein
MSTTLKMTMTPRLRVAVVAALGAPRDHLASAMATIPVTVELVDNPRRVVDVVKTVRPDALLIDPTCLGVDAVDVLRAIAALAERPYIIAAVGRVTQSLHAMLEAGVDDFVRAPVDGGEVWMRLRSVRPRPAPVADPSGGRVPCPSLSPGLDTFPPGLVGDLSDFVGEPFQVAREGEEAVLIDAVGAVVTLTHLEGAAELELTVSMDRAHVAGVVQRLLGAAPDDATIATFVTELANLSAGAMKRAMLDNGNALTIGLPEYFTGAHRPSSDARIRHRQTFDLMSANGVVRCAVVSKRTAVLGLPLHALREGLVLAREVRAANGMLLLTAGMRLTSAAIDRLQRSLQKAVQIEVVDAH